MTMRSGYWWLPHLVDFEVTSESTPQYNCFAWALGEDTRWIDPDPLFGYWPEDIPSDGTINSFIELFRSAGYEPCDDGSLMEYAANTEGSEMSGAGVQIIDDVIDPNRHYHALLGGGGNNKIRIKIACGSGDDVSVARVVGATTFVLDEDESFDPFVGPLLVNCERHGYYLGLLQSVPRGAPDEAGQMSLSMFLLLVPCGQVESSRPFGWE